MKKLISIILCSISIYFFYQPLLRVAEDAYAGCEDSGGYITTADCCPGVGDFSFNCYPGPCSCGPKESHTVQVCACPNYPYTCFDGARCVPNTWMYTTTSVNPTTTTSILTSTTTSVNPTTTTTSILTSTTTTGDPATGCGDSGGYITTEDCCLGVGDFTINCYPGPCSCGPKESHTVQYCACPNYPYTCFDGARCVPNTWLFTTTSVNPTTTTSTFATPVPDTGQTQSYTDTFGEDSDYTINPHSYTDLGNSVVRDNVTGLEWQQATAPSPTAIPINYCNNLSLGGYSDWRLPTIKELSTLVDSSISSGPTINTTYFPGTVASDYWSSTTYDFNTDGAWGVDFGDGHVKYLNEIHEGYYVRAVRGGQLPDNNFIDNGDGTISDTSTWLMWQKATAPGTYTWEQAITYCESLTLAGKSDWRLPNRNELQTIVDYSRYNPTIDTTFFPGTGAGNYWSSTTYATSTNDAWYVDFYGGDVYYTDKSYYSYYVRAVRGGQCGSTTTTTVQPTTTSSSTTSIITTTSSSTTSSIINDVNLSADENCNPKDVFNTSASKVEPIFVSATISEITPTGRYYNAYLVENRASWSNGDKICITQTGSCITSKPIYIDSSGYFCDELWTPPVGDNNLYDIVLDINGNGNFDIATDFVDSINFVGAQTTLVKLSAFTAIPESGKIILDWNTESEIDNAAFNIYRAESEDGNYVKINGSLISAKGSATQGASYEFIDTNVRNRKAYYYKLEDIDLNGKSTFHGPVSAVPRMIYGIGESVNR